MGAHQELESSFWTGLWTEPLWRTEHWGCLRFWAGQQGGTPWLCILERSKQEVKSATQLIFAFGAPLTANKSLRFAAVREHKVVLSIAKFLWPARHEHVVIPKEILQTGQLKHTHTD